MKFNPNIFKAYDIRGVYNEDFNEDFAYKLGIAYTNMRREEINQPCSLNFVVAKDMRLSSLSVQEALIKGMIDAGANVTDIEMVSTPTFYFAVAKFNYDGGIIVSASHNPKQWNGFKVVREKSLPVSENSGLKTLQEKIENNYLKLAEKRGKIKIKQNVLEKQIEHDLKFGNLKNIKKLKVVADAANGMGAQYTEEIFKHINAELIKLNFELDGTFPAHEADPLKEENLKQLKHNVIKEKADLGIALDGDGDRIFFVDEKGQAIKQSIIRAILSKIFLKERPGSKIGYDIRPGKITEDVIKENGGIPIVTKVGHSLIKETAIYENAYFAGESSGHFFLNMDIGCFEVPTIVILKILEEFSQSNKKVSEYIKPYDKYYHSGEINSEVKNKKKVLEKIKEEYQDGKISLLDGITVEYDNYWFNVRTSNTEEKVRLNLEARDKKTMEEKTKEILKLIRQ